MTDKTNSGWLKISRDLPDHWIWEDPHRLKWWLDLLMLAAWEDTKKLVGRKLIEVKRGQIVASISFLENRWGKNHNTVIDFLKLLQSEGMITKKSSNNISIITICNYEEYQGSDNLYDDINDTKSKRKALRKRKSSDNLSDNPCDNPKPVNFNFGADNLSDNVNVNKSVSIGSLSNNTADNLSDSLTDNLADTNKEYNINTFSNEKVSEPKGSLPHNAREGGEEENLDGNIPKSSKSKSKSPTLVGKARKVFEEFYQAQYETPYYWTAKDASNMKQLLQKIAYSREHRDNPLPVDDDSMLDALSKFLAKINKSWIADNFSVSIINSQYNAIISEIKNKSKQNNNGRTDSNRGFNPSYEERQQQVRSLVDEMLNTDYKEEDISGNY